MKIAIAITGASGVTLGVKLLKYLHQNTDYEIHAVISKSAYKTYEKENNQSIDTIEGVYYHDDTNLAAPFSSGSFGLDKLIILPCSMNTLAKCCVGITDTLITRAFSVMLKEKKQIVICPREMPFNTIQLENMTKLSTLGVVIAPPVLGYYSNQQTLNDMENFLIGKILDNVDIPNSAYKRWEG
ncbi:MAG: UbiX family flavin prenyltransferase [Campylobacterales bacterium]|nr:UbiX family flavin prenyltransferase [Campylobacterales bacterium]